jgi:general secretion pathway protein K
MPFLRCSPSSCRYGDPVPGRRPHSTVSADVRNDHRINTRTQTGVALITALLVVALATVTAVAMSSRLQLELRRVSNMLQYDQGYVYTLALQDWGKSILKRDLLEDKKRNRTVDSLDESWTQHLPATIVEGGQVAGYMEDLQARFNLNNLATQPGPATGPAAAAQQTPDPQVEYFKRLLRLLDLDQRLVEAVQDWMDPDINVRFPDGAEDSEYLNQDVPYRTANGPMASPSELLLVKGVTPKVYEKLTPYITVLPESTTINVNTASAEVLQVLSDQIDSAAIAKILEQRKKEPFKSTDEFMQALQSAMPDKKLPNELTSLISVSSSYFVAHAQAKFGRTQMELTSVINRSSNDGSTRVLARSLGAY